MSFLAVLGLTSTLVLMLFDEARAVSIDGSGPASALTTASEVEVTFTVDIPDNQLLPIHALNAVILKASTNDLGEADQVGSAACIGSEGCAPPDDTDGAEGAAILGIEGGDANPDSEFGYLTITNDGDTVIADDLFTAGYGYGYGYGYGGATGGTLTYTVRVDPGELGPGHYWIVFVIDTNSETMGDADSAPHYLRVTTPASSSPPPVSTPRVPTPAGPPTGLPPGPPPGTPQRVEFPTIEKGENGRAEGQVIIESDENEMIEVDLSEFDAVLSNLNFGNLGDSSAPVTLKVVVQRSPLPDVPDIPEGYAKSGGVRYLDIELEGGVGEEAKGMLEFSLDAEEIGDVPPRALVFLHFKDGQWVEELTFYQGFVNGRHQFAGEVTGLSPFAITFDVAAPAIGTLSPLADSTTNVLSTIGALVTDNRGMDITKTALYIDGQLVPAFLGPHGVFYTPSVPFTEGVHTARLVATDLGGQTSEKTWTFTAAQDAPIETPPTETPPTQTTTAPPASPPTQQPPTGGAEEQKDGIPGFELVALLAALGVALLVLRRRK